MSWDILRRQIRSLESKVDTALNEYSRLAAEISRGESSTSSSAWPGRDVEEGRNGKAGEEDNVQLEKEIEERLAELSTLVTKLTATLNDPDIPPSTSQMHAVQRHREVLTDYERDYRRSKTNVRHTLDRRDLIGSVRGDIDKYKTEHASDADALLAERGKIDNSHQMIDGTLDQAYATRADLASQRSTLQAMTSRMTNTANQVPGLNNLIRLISRRRRRDSIIMGCVVGVCTVLLLMFMTR